MNERAVVIGDDRVHVVTPGDRGIELDVERDEVGMITKVSLIVERPLEVSMNKHQGPVDLALALGLDVPQRAPLSLDTLREAWEQAEVPTEDAPIREGDVVIYPMLDGYVVRTTVIDHGSPTDGTRIRVLSRAPREPWRDLADVLMGKVGVPEHVALSEAKDLHAEGVRVVRGGDDDE